jgi:mannosyltransferase
MALNKVLVVTLLVGFALRVALLDHQSLWYDEAYSVYYARAGLTAIAGQQQADPLPYFVALWGWIKLAGSGEYAVRYLSVVLGMLTIPLVYKLVPNKRLGVLPAAMLAISAFHIYYSQEARLHVAAGFLAALMAYTLTRAVKHDSANRWLAYGAAAAGGLYTYYYLVLTLAGLNLPLALRRKRRRAWWLANLGAVALAAPGLILAYKRVTAFSEPYVPPLGPPPLQFLAQIPGYLFVDSALEQERVWALSGLTLVAAAVAFWTALRREGLVWHMLAWGFAIPAVGVFVIPTALSVFFHPRYEIIALPALLALLACAWRVHAAPRPWLTIVAAVCLLAPTGRALLNSWTQPAFQRDDNRGALALIRREALPDEVLVYDLPLQYDVIDYYGRDLGIPMQALPIPKNPTLPRDRQFVAETSDRPATERRLQELAAQHAGFWLLLSGDPVEWTEDWLDAHRTPVLNRWFGRVRLKHYRPAPAPDLRLPNGLRIAKTFGPLELLQARTGDITPGKPWPVDLLWQPAAPLERDITISLQVFDIESRRVAQLDARPFDGALPTSQWRAGLRYHDTMLLTLPPDLSPGVYDLKLSAYDSQGLAGQQTDILRTTYGPATARPVQAAAEPGWNLETVRVSPNGAVTLEGAVERTPPAGFTWFVHVLDADGRLTAQDDHPPLTPTGAWRQGDRFAEVFRLSGSGARLEIGAYDSSGRRVSWRQAGEPAKDHLEVPL